MNHRTLKALTLPELLISLSVIIILATVLLPSLAGARQRAAKAAAIKTVSTLRQKSEVLLTPTTAGSSTTSKVYRNDLCSVGFLEDAQNVTKRLSYAAYNPASDSFVKEVASNTDIGKDNAVTCHEKSDGTAWFVIADIETKTPDVTMYCTDYTGFAGEISPTNLVDDWQCDPDNSTVIYNLGSGFSQDGNGVCTPVIFVSIIQLLNGMIVIPIVMMTAFLMQQILVMHVMPTDQWVMSVDQAITLHHLTILYEP